MLGLAYDLPTFGYLAHVTDTWTLHLSLLYPVRISISKPAVITFIIDSKSIFLLCAFAKNRPGDPQFINCFTSCIIMEDRRVELRERKWKICKKHILYELALILKESVHPCLFQLWNDEMIALYLIVNVVLMYSHAPHNDVSVNYEPHIRRWSHNIIILTIVLQLPTVFSTVTCCTGL